MFDPSTNAELPETPPEAPEPIIAFSHVGISFDGRLSSGGPELLR